MPFFVEFGTAPDPQNPLMSVEKGKLFSHHQIKVEIRVSDLRTNGTIPGPANGAGHSLS